MISLPIIYTINIMESFSLPKNFFKDFNLINYGRGYLLKPPKNDKDIGIKYYYNAWWLPSSNAWFLKKEYKDFFIEYGAVYKDNMINNLINQNIKIKNLIGFEIMRVKCMCGECGINNICKYPPHDGWYLKYNQKLFVKNRINDFNPYNMAIFRTIIFGAKKNNLKKIWWITPSIGIKKFLECGAVYKS